MNGLVFLSLILYIFIRIIGLGVSIDFFYDTKEKKFILFTIGWIFWIISSLFPIFSDLVILNSLKEMFLFLNVIFVIIGGIFYMWGLFEYFMDVPLKHIMILIIVIILFPSFLYFFISFTISIKVSGVILNVLMVIMYVLPPIKKKGFVKFVGKSMRWLYGTIVLLIIYLPTSLIVSASEESYGLYNSNNPLLIILYYISSISITIMLLIVLVHIEYTISSRHKIELKDIYSHDIGNILQVIYSASDIIKNITTINPEEEEKLTLIKTKCKEASKIINEIRDL